MRVAIAPDAVRVATEPRRLEILQLVWDQERSVGEIAAALPVSTAAVSQHLSRLRASGLVTVRAEGRRRFYRAARDDMGALAVVLESFWSEKLDDLARLAHALERGPEATQPSPDLGRSQRSIARRSQ